MKPQLPTDVQAHGVEITAAILDRLVNSAHHVHMDGRSYRPNRRPGRSVQEAR